jgi:hypothetical protein
MLICIRGKTFEPTFKQSHYNSELIKDIENIKNITVPGCSMGSGMMLVEIRRTRILTEGNSQFCTQPEVGYVNGGWFLPNVPV